MNSDTFRATYCSARSPLLENALLCVYIEFSTRMILNTKETLSEKYHTHFRDS